MNVAGSRVITLLPTTSRLGVSTRNSSQPQTRTSTAVRNGCCRTLFISQLCVERTVVLFRQQPFPAIHPAYAHGFAQPIVKGRIVFVKKLGGQHFGAVVQM